MSSIHKIGILTSDIAIVVTQAEFTFKHGKNYRCKPTDKLIDVQVRTIEDDILNDYAKYIICTVDSILSKKEEPSHFCENKRHRCRTYQLYVMLEQVFSYLLPPMTVFQKEGLSKLLCLIDNSIQMFYTPSEIYLPANDYDIHLLNTLITPRVALMQEKIKNHSLPDELIKMKSDAYHVEGNLAVNINKTIYDNALRKIQSTYLNYI